jgi:AcrR family transcriptional regulator
MAKTDRRIKRTRDLLQKALTELLKERSYSAITIQDVVNRANVGRTTFYDHYKSKNALFISCHEAVFRQFHFGPHQLSKDELLSLDVPPKVIATYQQLFNSRELLSPVFQGEDSRLILRRVRERSAQEIAANLCAAFPDADSAIPIEVLANYLAGAQLALVQWWLETRQPHTPDMLAQTFHRLQRAAIRDALGLADGESG